MDINQAVLDFLKDYPKPKETIPGESPLQVRNKQAQFLREMILIPKCWPNKETRIMVPAKINWAIPINESEYQAGISFRGQYPWDSDCHGIYILKKVGNKFIPIRDYLNQRRLEK